MEGSSASSVPRVRAHQSGVDGHEVGVKGSCHQWRVLSLLPFFKSMPSVVHLEGQDSFLASCLTWEHLCPLLRTVGPCIGRRWQFSLFIFRDGCWSASSLPAQIAIIFPVTMELAAHCQSPPNLSSPWQSHVQIDGQLFHLYLFKLTDLFRITYAWH